MKWWPFSNRSIKTSQGQVGFTQKHSFPSDNIRAYTKEGYGQNPTVFACVDLIAKSLARIPLKVKNSAGEIVDNHPLLSLLEQPNPDEGGNEFRHAATSWFLITGNCFMQKLTSSGVPNQLLLWQPYEWSISRRLGDPVPRLYTFGKNQRYERSFDVDPITGKSEILHWRTFNPSTEGSEFGQAPLKAAASCVDSANSARLWNYSTLENSGSHSVVITSDDEITPDQKKSITQDVFENWMGPKNANKVKVMGSAAKVDTISMTPHEMEWLEGLKLQSQEICANFGVPTQLLGIDGSQTYANYEEAKVALFTQTVIPILDLLLSELNRWLSDDFAGAKICYNEDDIPALEPLRREKRAELLRSDVLTINEKRELLGYEPRKEEEADKLFIQPNDIPLDETFADDLEDEDGEENASEE